MLTALTLKSGPHRPPFEIGPPGQLQYALQRPAHRGRAPRRGRELSCPPGSEPTLGPHRAVTDARQGATVCLAAMWVVAGPAPCAAERGDAMARSLQEFLDGRRDHDH